jgi:hypothetical protein
MSRKWPYSPNCRELVFSKTQLALAGRSKQYPQSWLQMCGRGAHAPLPLNRSPEEPQPSPGTA